MPEEVSKTMTMGAMKAWLSALSTSDPLTVPLGLPEGLGALRGAINLPALGSWFPAFVTTQEITGISVNSSTLKELSVQGTLKNTQLKLTIRFVADSDAPKESDPVTGVVVSLSLASTDKFGFLAEVLKAVGLDFEIRKIDGG